ncbi:double zinc ribbon domain-containing protein [Halarchaeum salinum]
MSKITFRADAGLVERVEALDASKSEVMRRALRAYLDEPDDAVSDADGGGFDALLDARIDERIATHHDGGGEAGDVTVNVNVADDASDAESGDTRAHAANRNATADDAGPRNSTTDDGGPASDAREPGESEERACPQCGEGLAADHAFCPNCGERAAGRPTCECGVELRSDWAFCPDCGRRTVAGDVLDR